MATTYPPTQYMGLVIPIPSAETGPQWALDISGNGLSGSGCFGVIDGHDHVSVGKPLSQAAISVSGAFPLNINPLLSTTYIQFSGLSATPVVNSSLSAVSGLSTSANDLVFIDGSGHTIQLTSAGSPAAAPQTIVGFNIYPSYFAFTQHSTPTTPATLWSGPMAILPVTPGATNSTSITLSVPSGISSAYNFVLPIPPSGVGVVNSLLQQSPAGAVTPITPPSSGTNVVCQDNTGATSFVSYGWVPTGVCLPYGGSSAPTGWLLCNGASVSTTTYAALFAVIGYSFGGSGSSFSLPNVQGNTIVGAGGPVYGSLGNTVGATGGESVVALTQSQLPAHIHTTSINQYGSAGFSSVDNLASGAGTFNGTATFSSSSVGSGGAHDNIQPSIVMNYIIKT